jgi:hypothetical protein
MRLLTTLFLVCSLVGCGHKPDIYHCIINAPNQNRKCYHADRDYDDKGNLRPGAVAVYRPNPTIEHLNKAYCIDSDDEKHPFEVALERAKAYGKTIREELEECKAQKQP